MKGKLKNMPLIFLLLMSQNVFIFAQSNDHLNTLSPINPGEKLEYKLGWGWLTLGKADVLTMTDSKSIDGQLCYEMEIAGRSAGVGSLYYFDDKWGSTFDQATYYPYTSYRDLKEGKYRLKEYTFFNRDSMSVLVQSEKKHGPLPDKTYPMKSDFTLDLISGLAYTRGLDFDQMQKGQLIEINGFFEDKFYSFTMTYEGKEKIKSKVGKIWCWKIVPIMPDNKLFRGENAVTIWISADANRLPLKIEAAMFFGSAYCELTSYKNVKYGLDSN